MPAICTVESAMWINADFSRRVVVPGDAWNWVASPQAGVERVMLDRIGGEQARATSFVRYSPGADFPAHDHPGGEEILVLSGTFSEDGKDFPAGWYLRSPPGSRHCPASAEGTVIFVKLRQMRPDERAWVRLDARDPARWRKDGDRRRCDLFTNEDEAVCLLALAPGLPLLAAAAPGAEAVVLAGALLADGQRLGPGSWLRLPPGAHPDIVASPEGATVYLKTGALGLWAPDGTP